MRAIQPSIVDSYCVASRARINSGLPLTLNPLNPASVVSVTMSPPDEIQKSVIDAMSPGAVWNSSVLPELGATESMTLNHSPSTNSMNVVCPMTGRPSGVADPVAANAEQCALFTRRGDDAYLLAIVGQ
eukprot:Amastigsp_a514574_17.p5 type:complete len:129 gc:universal Amastigsp_a514574_17:660-1046(+)